MSQPWEPTAALPPMTLRGPAAGHLLRGTAATAAIWFGFLGYLSAWPEMPIAVTIGGPLLGTTAVLAWLATRYPRLVLGTDRLVLLDGTVLPWCDISSVEMSGDGSSLLLFLFEAPSFDGCRSLSDTVSRVPVVVKVRGFASSPSAIASAIAPRLEAYRSQSEEAARHDEQAARGRADWTDEDDMATSSGATRVLRGLSVIKNSAAGAPASKEVFPDPSERALSRLVHELPNGCDLTLQSSGAANRRAHLRLVRALHGQRYMIESRDRNRDIYRTESDDWRIAREIALSWSKGETEWRRLVVWLPFVSG